MKKLLVLMFVVLLGGVAIASDIDGQSLFMYYELPKGTTVAITISAPTPFYVNNSSAPITSLTQNYVIPRSATVIDYVVPVSTQTTYISIYGKLK